MTSPLDKISGHNVKYVVQVDENDNSPGGEEYTDEQWPSGSKSVRVMVVLSMLTLATAAGFLWWQAAIGAYSTEAEEAVEIAAGSFVATGTNVDMEPFFTGFADIAEKKGWTKLDRANPAAELEMTVAFQLRNVDELEERLLAASTPGNSEYGKWLTKEQVHELTSPAQNVIDAVVAWHGASLDDYHPGGFVKRVVTVAEAEVLLNSEYYVYEHTSGRQINRMSKGYSVDSSVAPYISFVSPSVRLPARTEMESGLTYEEMGDGVDPIDAEIDSAPLYLRTMYNITESGSAPGNKQGVAEFLTQIFSQSDQDTFYNRFYPKGAGTQIVIKGRTRVQEGNYAGIETMLDTEYITVTGTGVPTEDWSYMFDPTIRDVCPFLDWILDVGSTDDSEIPKVFSVSYGDDESDVGQTYANRLNIEFMKTAMRGISVLFASGDSGADCVRGEFSPDFPGALPYVTAVGGTRGDDVHDIDSWRLSGGGFSTYFDRPAWQDAYVNTYLEIEGVREKAEMYGVNIDGRGYPDVSAMAVGYPVVCTGVAYLVSGTSCATPVFAGIISLLNDYRLSNGKPTLGFLNPWLYSDQVSKTLVDVVEDYNEGCGPIGWYAAKGWDPVTGLGYPNFGNLRDLIE